MVDTAHLDDFTGRCNARMPDRCGSSLPTADRSQSYATAPPAPLQGVPSRSVCDAPHRSKPRWRRRTGASPEGKYLVE